jgi:hypothetical protein
MRRRPKAVRQKTEYKTSTKEEATRVADILQKPIGRTKEDEAYLQKYKSVEERTLGGTLSGDFEAGPGVAVSGTKEQTRRVEYENGKVSIKERIGVDASAGYDPQKKSGANEGSVGLAGAGNQSSVELETTSKPKPDFDVGSFQNGSNDKLDDSEATSKFTATGSYEAKVLGNGGAGEYSASITGKHSDLKNTADKLRRGDPSALGDIVNNSQAEVEVSTKTSTGIDVNLEGKTPVARGSVNYKSIREDTTPVYEYTGKLSDLPQHAGNSALQTVTRPIEAVGGFVNDRANEFRKRIFG